MVENWKLLLRGRLVWWPTGKGRGWGDVLLRRIQREAPHHVRIPQVSESPHFYLFLFFHRLASWRTRKKGIIHMRDRGWPTTKGIFVFLPVLTFMKALAMKETSISFFCLHHQRNKAHRISTCALMIKQTPKSSTRHSQHRFVLPQRQPLYQYEIFVILNHGLIGELIVLLEVEPSFMSWGVSI